MATFKIKLVLLFNKLFVYLLTAPENLVKYLQENHYF